MRKPVSKSKSTKDKFTVTEVGTLIDQFRGEFRVFGERQEGITEKLDATHEQVARNTEDLALIKVAVKGTQQDIAQLNVTVEGVKGDIADLKADVKGVKGDIADLKADVKGVKGDIADIRLAVKDMAAKIEKLTESIDRLIKTKADREDFQALDKRISILETKVESLKV